MRDPQRIPRLLKDLEGVWRENPDLRLGQMVSNASGFKKKDCDPYYMEDDDLIKAIKVLHGND